MGRLVNIQRKVICKTDFIAKEFYSFIDNHFFRVDDVELGPKIWEGAVGSYYSFYQG
jgi:hypothetical protein